MKEKEALDVNRTKLETFIAGKTFAALDADEQDRLQRQIIAMNHYSLILGARIAAFPKGDLTHSNPQE